MEIQVFDIKTVIGDEIELLPALGNVWVGDCPFCKGREQAFLVNDVVYKCGMCGKGGNAINFIMELKKKTYEEAVAYLVAKYRKTSTQ
jgi:DNA primase